MAIYVMSDIHGCKKEFDQMLQTVEFSDYDELYVIGDLCDRGNENMTLVHELMAHPNMHAIMGNHDEWFLRYSQNLIDSKRENGENTVNINNDMMTWLHYNGGYKTANEYMDLEFPDCYDIKCWLENIPYYVELELGGEKYLLIHAGLGPEPQIKPLYEVNTNTLVWGHIGIDDNPYEDRTLIVGHTPTFLYGQSYEGKILHGTKRKILHIDCGCVYGRTLGCIRLDDKKEFYVPSTYPYLKTR